MVKFGRKFFFDSKHSKKGKLLTYIIIALIVIAVIIIFALILRAINKNRRLKHPETQIVLRKTIDNEIYDVLPDKTTYFKKLVNFDIEDVNITYPDYLPLEENYDECSEEEIKIIEEIKNGKDETQYENPYACVRNVTPTIGSYDVKVSYNDKEYTVTLNVVDTKAPTVVGKNHEITEGDEYKISDFIESCADNSKKDCSYEYYYKEYNAEEDYSKLNKVGSHEVSIVAIDESGNKSAPVSATLVIKEKPQVKVFTVSFNSDGGTNVDNQMVIENEKATTPKNPTKSGYTFTGWYLNGSKFDFNSPITADITLTAGWNKYQAPASTCSTGDLKYDASKYPVVALYVTNGNCPISKNNLNVDTFGNKANAMMNAEMAKLKKWQDANGYDYYFAVVGKTPQGVLNTSGKGYVGYTIEFSIAKQVGNGYSELARYFLRTDGSRKFSLNLINMPES